MATKQLSTYDIVPTALAVTAMRDNGYKNAAYAVAELMDNSLQAGAGMVEMLCADDEIPVAQRTRRRLHEIALLDNGSGMDADTLQMALQFGNGTRLDTGKKQGLGRFGMGLPSASISQCRRVEVWTWQKDPKKALYSYIDLDEVDAGDQDEVPKPVAKDIPEIWLKTASKESFKKTGTLVVWSKIDRSMWRTSRALIDNSKELIGRMYRNWIDEGKATIRLASFLVSNPDEMLQDEEALPNDPMYLMKNTSTPDPYDKEPMFEPFPSKEGYEVKQKFKFHDAEHEVTIRFSMAKEEARKGDNPGNRDYGQHAARNTGVSVVRAGRELELDPGWTTSYDPIERWWGVEVCFDAGLDELFGVSNNKQSARNFAEAAKVDAKALAKQHGGSISAARQALEDEGDPLAPLLEVIFRIQSNITQMRQQLRSQTEGSRRRRHPDSPEERATKAVERRKQAGHKGESDKQEEESDKDRKKALAEGLEESGHSKKESKDLAAETISKGLKYRMETSPIEGGAFFSVQSKGGVLLVTLNTEHPAYELLLGAETPDELPNKPEELKARLRGAQEGLEMMLFAWARYEDEQVLDQRRQAQNVRFDWGRMAENFLEARGS